MEDPVGQSKNNSTRISPVVSYVLDFHVLKKLCNIVQNMFDLGLFTSNHLSNI